MALLRVAFLAVGLLAGHAAGQTIGGFDLARGGAGSWRDGFWTVNARNSVLANFAGASFSAANTLTAEYLESVDMVILMSATGNNSAIVPLSAGEQTALANFVAGGGRAMIISDNGTFSGMAPAANGSLLSPFGVAADGTLSGDQQAHMILANNPIASGPFGSVGSFSASWPGWLSSWNAGMPIARLAANNEAAGLIIDQDELGAGSGRVSIFSDTWALDFMPGSANETVFLNAFAWTVVPAPGAIALLGAAAPFAIRRRR